MRSAVPNLSLSLSSSVNYFVDFYYDLRVRFHRLCLCVVLLMCHACRLLFHMTLRTDGNEVTLLIAVLAVLMHRIN